MKPLTGKSWSNAFATVNRTFARNPCVSRQRIIHSDSLNLSEHQNKKMKSTNEHSTSIHQLEVHKKRLERSREIVIANYEEALMKLNTDMVTLKADIITLKEKELAELRNSAVGKR